MSQSVHVEIKKIGPTGADRQRADKAIGEMQTSCISTNSQQSPRRNRQGGVVDRGDWFRDPGSEIDVSATCRDQVSLSSKSIRRIFMCD